MLLRIRSKVPNNLETKQRIPSKTLIASVIHADLHTNLFGDSHRFIDVIITKEDRLTMNAASTDSIAQKTSLLNKANGVVLTNFTSEDVLRKAVSVLTYVHPTTCTSIRVHTTQRVHTSNADIVPTIKPGDKLLLHEVHDITSVRSRQIRTSRASSSSRGTNTSTRSRNSNRHKLRSSILTTASTLQHLHHVITKLLLSHRFNLELTKNFQLASVRHAVTILNYLTSSLNHSIVSLWNGVRLNQRSTLRCDVRNLIVKPRVTTVLSNSFLYVNKLPESEHRLCD